MKKIIISIFFCVSCFFISRAQSITVTGGAWNASVSVPTEAGNDYALSSIQSASNQSLVNINMPGVTFIIWYIANSYTVNIRRIDSGINWDSAGIQIWVNRTGDGTGGGCGGIFGTNCSTITGGTSLQQVTTTNLYFFDGANYGLTPRINIPIQYEIRNISVLRPVANYSTTIIYTLVDN